MLLIGAAMWVSHLEGEATLQLLDYEIRSSVAVLLIGLVAIIALISVILPLLMTIITAPFGIKKRLAHRRNTQGLTLVTQTLAAISTGDVKAASKLVKQTSKLLPKAPITPLLQAQLAGLNRDEAMLKQSFEAMLEHHDTEALASKSLAEWHHRKGQIVPALEHATRASELEPANRQTVIGALGLYVKANDYVGAHRSLMEAKARKALSRKETNALQSLLYISEATHAPAEQAVQLTEAAYTINSEQIAIILAHAHQLANSGQHDALVKLLKSVWKQHAHPELAALIIDLPLEDKPWNKLVRGLLKKSPPNLASLLLEAQMKLRETDYVAARSLLTQGLEQFESPDILKMLAKLEMEEAGDDAAAKQWLEQREFTHATEGWHCTSCQHVQESWSLACDACGGVDGIHWDTL